MSRQPIKKQTVRTLTDYQQESRAGILFNLQRDTLEGRRPTETGEPAESSKPCQNHLKTCQNHLTTSQRTLGGPLAFLEDKAGCYPIGFELAANWLEQAFPWTLG